MLDQTTYPFPVLGEPLTQDGCKREGEGEALESNTAPDQKSIRGVTPVTEQDSSGGFNTFPVTKDYDERCCEVTRSSSGAIAGVAPKSGIPL